MIGRSVLAEDISDNAGRWKTIVCRWHDPGGIQGDGKHSHLERRHYRQLRACRRSPNRKSINIRAVASDGRAGVRGGPVRAGSQDHSGHVLATKTQPDGTYFGRLAQPGLPPESAAWGVLRERA